MTESSSFFIPLEEIDASERIREDIGKDDFEELAASILTDGQLQELVVSINPEGNSHKYKLVAGGRRFLALTKLYEAGDEVPRQPKGTARCNLRDNLPRHTQLLIEGSENIHRKDFSWLEKAKFIRLFHETMIAEYEGSWTADLTARSLKLSAASISHYLRIEEAVRNDPAVAKAQTVNAAVKRMKVQERVRARLDDAKDKSSVAMSRAQDVLWHGDCREWIRTITDASIDLVNFDPPWGNNASHKSQENHEGFDDSTEYADELMGFMLTELYRVLKNDRFMIFWYRNWNYNAVVEMLEATGFNLNFNRSPCFWYKPDKITDQNRIPEKQLIDAYETFLLARKGDPIFYDRSKNNVFEFPRVVLGAITHPTEKPVPLCDSLVRLCTVPGETVLDPTSGSSAMPHAALIASRKAKACELSKTYYDRGIIRITDYFKQII